jgi:HK97 family phage portal protein
MKLLDKAKALFGFEGAARGPFNGMGELGGFYGIEPYGDGWQRNLEIDRFEAKNVPAVYACVMAISRAISQCYPVHRRLGDNGSVVTVETSAAYRTLRNPNSYQVTPGFLLNLVATALFDGESFALGRRNDRNEIVELHILPRGGCSPIVDPDTKTIFYSVGASPLVDGGADFVVPARDVLHLRFHTPRHPLIGESPIRAAALAIGINVALSQNQAAFFNRMNRPSGVLSTDATLTREQMVTLRAAFEEQSKKWAAGGMPILSSGLKFQALGVTSQDAQLVEAQRMSLQDICRCFGVPPAMIGEMSQATLSNAESMIHSFMSISLGSYLEHIERAFDRLFGLPNTEFIELDTSALLRTDFAGRIDGLTKAIQGGLITPDEARAREGMGPVDGGAVAYMQRQMTPIDKISEILEAEIKAKETPAPPPVAPDPKPENLPPPVKTVDLEVAKALIQNLITRARENA